MVRRVRLHALVFPSEHRASTPKGYCVTPIRVIIASTLPPPRLGVPFGTPRECSKGAPHTLQETKLAYLFSVMDLISYP